MKYRININAGVEWSIELEAENKEEAGSKAVDEWNSEFSQLRDYNFDYEVEEVN